MKKIYIAALLSFIHFFLSAQTEFITTWKTDNPGSSNSDQIIIPTHPSENYNYTVDWGDGNSDTGVTGNIIHTYVIPGTYEVKITGLFPSIYFNNVFGSEGNDSFKILEVNQWGNNQWNNLETAFAGCVNLDIVAQDVPDLSNVDNLFAMFASCSTLKANEKFNDWDVGNITNMDWLFRDCLVFDQNIGSWDVGNVTSMSSLFYNCHEFNQDISPWNVSQVTNMSRMFFYDYAFNQDIDNWNVGNVTTMSSLFKGAIRFNKNIDDWDVSKVTNMSQMFQFAYAFNQSLENWNVGVVTDMNSMFDRATVFDQDIGNWDVTNVTNMENMFFEIGLSKANYDNLLNGWASLPTLQNGVILNAGTSEYCVGLDSKEELINDYGWVISDGGEDCPMSKFVTRWKTDNPGASADNQITIPTFPAEIYNYTVEWGDGSTNTNITGDIVHTYASPGTYRVIISGLFPRIFFNNYTSGFIGDEQKIVLLQEWGPNQWSSMELAFSGCKNLIVNAVDVPDLSNVTSMYRMFAWSIVGGNDKFNQWDVSNITNMAGAFDKTSFNQDISSWNVENVTDMSYLFFSSPFNHDVSNWDVSKVTNMAGTFGSSSFKQDVTGWDVSSVTNMDFMFNSTFFDQDISSWNVSNVTSMRHMLSQSSFNKDIGNWDIGQVADMANIFDDNDLSRENYDKILIAWSQLPSLQFGIDLGAKDVQYCLGKDARQTLMATNGWSIIDQGENCEEARPFITTWKTDNPGVSESNQITIPTNPREVYNYSVNWGDGTSDTDITEDITHTYAEPGIYQVSISGRFPAIYFNGASESYQYPAKNADTDKILSVDQWGTNRWISLSFAFAGCSNLDVIATDVPDFSKDVRLGSMFLECTSLKGNEHFNEWDMSYISFSASNMFNGATRFNQPLDQWDVSKIRYLNGMFKGATTFNRSLENWNVGKAENLDGMFDDSRLSITNYDKILNAWSMLPTLLNNVRFGANSTYYCTSETAKQLLVNNYGWIITDAGHDCTKAYFKTTWKTDNPGVSDDNQITIPTFPGENYNYTVEWGDGSTDTNITGDITHTYSSAGTYEVSIYGNFTRIYFNDFESTINESGKIIAVNQWGDIQWSSMTKAFAGCSNLDILATDIPDFTYVDSIFSMFAFAESLVYNPSINEWNTATITNMSQVFSGATFFNQPLTDWDVSNVTNMSRMFQAAKAFNQDIGDWSVGNVTNMESMFTHSQEFNQDITNWNVSNVTIMNGLFWDTPFNQDIGNWDTRNVNSMYGMFVDNKVFNQDIGNWDVGSVQNFGNMFVRASSFNQDLGKWDVSNVEYMSGMFSEAVSFDQDISDWKIGNVIAMDIMFKDSGLSLVNYDNLLQKWSNLPILQSNVLFDAGNSQYCESKDARQSIVDTYGWTITDAGEVPLCNEDNDEDGVLDHKDACLDTRPGAVVNSNGCDSVSTDSIKVYVSTPSCTDSSDGAIEVSMNVSGYLLNISIEGQSVSNQFDNVSSDSSFKIGDLPVGMYSITVAIPDILFEQKYGVTVNELNSLGGKRTVLDPKSGKVSYSVKGSKTYMVSVNGQVENFAFDNKGEHTIALENLSGQNEIVISGESDCQGKISDSFFIGNTIQVFPTITSSNINLLTNSDDLQVRVYGLEGRLVKELNYQQRNNIIDISTLESGIYFLRMTISGGQQENIKIVKQ